MNKYLIHWLDGTTTEVSGDSIAAAFTNAGFGGGAINAIDWYDVIESADGASQ